MKARAVLLMNLSGTLVAWQKQGDESDEAIFRVGLASVKEALLSARLESVVGNQPTAVIWEKNSRLDPLQTGLETGLFGGGWESFVGKDWLLMVAFFPDADHTALDYTLMREQIERTKTDLHSLLY